MSRDLTRWNRAGRTRFEYVDGNAAVWLEWLRRELHERFPECEAFAAEVRSGETEALRLERLERQYHAAERGDLLWELTRAFSRACHVVTEHASAYANEGYLRTATQWENLRRLVEMIDYHPAPPASASTELVWKAKAGTFGTVEPGLQIKYSPPDGGAAVVFETLESIYVHADLNALRLDAWNRSTLPLGRVDAVRWISGDDVSGLSAGQVGLLVRKGEVEAAAVVEIDSLDASGTPACSLAAGQPATASWPLADVTLRVRPSQIYPVLASDSATVRFEAAHGLSAGDVITWRSGGTWRFDRVREASDESVLLVFGSRFPAAGTAIHKASVIERPTGEFLFAVDEPEKRVAHVGDAGIELDDPASGATFSIAESNAEGRYYRVTDASVQALYVAPGGAESAARIGIAREIDSESFEVLGGPGQLASGDWIAAETSDGVWSALRVERVVEREDRFLLDLEAATPAQLDLQRIVGPFRYELVPEGADTNTTALREEELSTLTVILPQSSAARDALAVGRRLILEQETDLGYVSPVSATVTRVLGNAVSISPALSQTAGFTRGNTVIRANVVLAGHGESQPERVLGSGDATESHQSFEFARRGVSFVPDGTMAAGVRADIAVEVAGQTWAQVSTLNDAGPTDAQYTVRMSEGGFLRIEFGDGARGRRLPTGTGNVRIAWRKGAGLAGNLGAGSLGKPVKPHRLLDEVRQPRAAAGGADMEAAESLRSNAPATLLTLERAVSIRDFQHLALAHSSVWQANAFPVRAPSSREDGIEVVVVPSGGGTLGTLAAALELHLQNHAIPGVSVRVSDYEPVLVSFEVTVQVRTEAFEPETVTATVASKLREAFGLKRRKLGQPLYRAELYQEAEAVSGVESSDCRIIAVDESKTTKPVRRHGAGRTLEALYPNGRQLIEVAPGAGAVTVHWRRYSL